MDQDFATVIQKQWISSWLIFIICVINLRCAFEPLISCCSFFPLYEHIDQNFVHVAVVLPVQQPAVTNSSSSEDEAGKSGSNVVRRRRLRKNTTSTLTEPEEEALESGQSEEEEDEGQQEEKEDVRPAAAPGVQSVQGQGSSILNKCIVIALIVAISMGFGHFHGKWLLMLL